MTAVGLFRSSRMASLGQLWDFRSSRMASLGQLWDFRSSRMASLGQLWDCAEAADWHLWDSCGTAQKLSPGVCLAAARL